MCEPATIAAVAMVVGAGVSAYSTYQTGKTQETFANFEAAQGEADARAEQGDAQVEAERLRKIGKMNAAEANASMAASGANLGSAGALQINRQITENAEHDAYITEVGGDQRAMRLNTQAGLTRAQGKAARQGATLSAFATAVSGAGAAYGGWKKAQQPSTGGVS